MNGGIRKVLSWTRMLTEFVLVCSYSLSVELSKTIFHIVVPRKCKDIKGETVLVTGAARGIGRELALKLSTLGCHVICVDINAEGIMRTAQDIVKMGHKAQAYTCDVTDNTAVEELAKKVGYVDILVNNAGLLYFDPILNTPPSSVSKVLETNVASHFLMIRNFLPGMLERNKGHIVAIASCCGLIALANVTLYTSSKYAVVGLMGSLTEELKLLGRSNIKTTCVCPYLVRTIPEIDSEVDARIPPLEAVDAAREIVKGILQERGMFTVPNYLRSVITTYSLLPDNTSSRLKDVIYTRIKHGVM